LNLFSMSNKSKNVQQEDIECPIQQIQAMCEYKQQELCLNL